MIIGDFFSILLRYSSSAYLIRRLAVELGISEAVRTSSLCIPGHRISLTKAVEVFPGLVCFRSYDRQRSLLGPFYRSTFPHIKEGPLATNNDIGQTLLSYDELLRAGGYQ